MRSGVTVETGFQGYRVRLRNLVYWFWPAVPLWGKWPCLWAWTEYDGEELRRKYKKSWPARLAMAAEKKRFEIKGVGDDGKVEALSYWRRDELRRAEDVAAAVRRRERGRTPLVAGQAGRPAGIGVGSLVRHIRDVEGITNYDEVLAILEESGIQQVVDWVAHWGKDARRRVVELYSESNRTHAAVCAYCEGQPMPEKLRGAIERRKTPVE